MPTPLVSVVLPVRDGGEYLQAAVDSILAQTFSDFELLLVDDHSRDGAVEALHKGDPRLKIIENDGAGVVSAFRQGMEMARGVYVARMDADDIALPARLELQLAYLRDHPEVMIAGACIEFISDQAIAGGNRQYQQWLNSVCDPQQIGLQLFVESPIPNPTAMFRHEALTRLGGYREVEWPEDYDLFLRADAAGMRMGKPETVLLQWRDHVGRLTRTDPRYARSRFQQAKAYFLANYRLPDRPLIIWGAGPGGRDFHDLLKAEGRAVGGFIDVHPRRAGGLKRGQPVWSHEHPDQWGEGFILVAVGARGARVEIGDFLAASGRSEGEDYLFVM